MQNPRPDSTTAQVVESGIALQETRGRVIAVAFLFERGVNSNVIVRVLTEPSRRRRYSD